MLLLRFFRYLEELSQSYKRQTERLSASFNLTTAWLKATAKGAEERDLHQQERIDALEARLTKLLRILAEQGLLELVAQRLENGEFCILAKEAGKYLQVAVLSIMTGHTVGAISEISIFTVLDATEGNGFRASS